MWFKSKKQKALKEKEKVEQSTESAILEAAKQIMFKKEVEKNLQVKVNALEQQNRDLKIKNAELQKIIDAVKGVLK